jgi:hypothetical protein
VRVPLRILLAALGLQAFALQGVAADGAPLTGRRIADVLAETSTVDLRFLYSSQLVPDGLRVLHEPTEPTPLGRVREILAAHHLALVQVAPGIHAIGPATPAARAPARVATGAGPDAVADSDIAPEPSFETQIIGERYPYGLKLADDAVIYSATRLSQLPSLGEDAMYTLSRQPGMSQGELTGQLNIRGGQANETLILFDGFPIREAFHMPGYRSLLSVFDPSLLSGVSVYTGAMPARYGDRMSGVVEFRSIDADEPLRTSLGAGFLNARARTVQPLGEGGGDMLFAVRAGSTGYLLRALQPAASNPRYGDGLARLRLPLGDATTLSFNALYARDELGVNRDGLQETSRLRTALGYYWLHSATRLGLGSRDALLDFWLGNSQIDTERSGVLDSPGFASGDLAEHRRTGIWDARGQLQWSPGDAHAVDAGFALTRGQAIYAYHSAVQYAPGIGSRLGVPDANSQDYDIAPHRHSASAYLADTWSLRPGVTAQAGLRFSQHSAPGSTGLNEWDPRLMLSWQALPATTLRSGWGRVHQVSDLNEIVPGRDPQGRLVGQESEYWVLGLDQSLPHTMQLRIDAFRKEQMHLLPLQRNLLRTPSILPELSIDRGWWAPLAAHIEGVELNLQQSSRHWHWVAAYALSAADETYANGRQRRSGDQRHVGSFTLDWTAGNWLAGSVLNYRSGLPTTTFATDADGNLVIGRRNAARLPDTLGLDLRLTWRHAAGAGTFRATAQVSNLFGNDGSCCSELAAVPDSNPPAVRLRKDGSLPPVPWIGIAWDF